MVRRTADNRTRTMVAEGNPFSFEEFMEWALYHPVTGYYRQAPASLPGREGDFFTASQLQPTFGSLLSSLLPMEPVLELGPGRGEMRAAFAPRQYSAIGPGDALPDSWSGTIFANEFFDALPVIAGVREGAEWRELQVGAQASTFHWEVGPPLSPQLRAYALRYFPHLPQGGRFEIAERAVLTIRRISECLRRGTVLIIDYGWSGREYLRFPAGTLMSYRNHRATPDVLRNPGGQDITAHVPFPALKDAAEECGLRVVRFETLSQLCVRALALRKGLPSSLHQQSQLKTLLFGMGESFRALWLSKTN